MDISWVQLELERIRAKFVNPENLRITIWRENYVNPKFHPNPLFFFLLTDATWYHGIYIVLTRFPPFTGYESDIFKVNLNIHLKR